MSEKSSGRESGVSRRLVLATSGAALTSLTGCMGATSSADTLRVSAWSGTNETVFRDVIKPRYEETTDNTLEVTGNWQGILSQIRQAPADDPPFDVTVGVGRTHYRGRQDDLWEPVNYDNLSNAGGIKPRLLDYPMSEQGVPVAYGAHAYVYNEDSVTWNPTEWADVRSEDAENIALPSDFWLKLFMMAAITTDDEPLADEVYDQSNADALLDIIESVPTSTFYQGTQQLWTALNQGLADVGHYFFAYGLQKAETTDDMNIGVTVPTRTTGYIDYYQVVRGTDNRQAAEEFIDFLLDPEVQTAYASEFNLGMSHTDAEHPDVTAANLPTTNDELQEVAFQNFARVADYSGDLSERFRALVQDA